MAVVYQIKKGIIIFVATVLIAKGLSELGELFFAWLDYQINGTDMPIFKLLPSSSTEKIFIEGLGPSKTTYFFGTEPKAFSKLIYFVIILDFGFLLYGVVMNNLRVMEWTLIAWYVALLFVDLGAISYQVGNIALNLYLGKNESVIESVISVYIVFFLFFLLPLLIWGWLYKIYEHAKKDQGSNMEKVELLEDFFPWQTFLGIEKEKKRLF